MQLTDYIQILKINSKCNKHVVALPRKKKLIRYNEQKCCYDNQFNVRKYVIDVRKKISILERIMREIK